jgi:anaerobic magnesium-protoporphyrin IX monomethyl ester cyclase
LYYDPKEAANKKPYPPLASITLAGWIKEKLNIDAEFYDVMFDRDEKGLVDYLNHTKPDIFILYDDDFNFLTKMCLENMRNAIFKVLSRVEKSGLFIAHGSDASDQAEKYLNAGFDVVVHRNAEKVIINIIEEYCRSHSLDHNGIQGITFYDGEIKNNPQVKTNFTLEDAPAPRWDIIDLAPYRRKTFVWKNI